MKKWFIPYHNSNYNFTVEKWGRQQLNQVIKINTPSKKRFGHHIPPEMMGQKEHCITSVMFLPQINLILSKDQTNQIKKPVNMIYGINCSKKGNSYKHFI